MIAKLAQEKYDLSVLDKLPAGYPISGIDVANRIGGNDKYWVWNPKTGEWHFEAFPFLPGVDYVRGVGHISGGRILVGAEQTDIRTTKIFDFNQQPVDMASSMKAPGSLPAILFVRAGDAAPAPAKNVSWYTWGLGNVVPANGPSIEQATLMGTDFDGCPVAQMPQILLERARKLAIDQGNPQVTAYWWNEGRFVKAR
jgi:hypothetical protein